MEYSIYGIGHEVACKLIDELKVLGVQANITLGGISIVPTGTIEFDAMNRVCRKYNTEAQVGSTRFGEDIVMKKKKLKHLEDFPGLVFINGFETALLGIVTQCNEKFACYNYEMCIEILMDRDELEREEAVVLLREFMCNVSNRNNPAFLE